MRVGGVAAIAAVLFAGCSGGQGRGSDKAAALARTAKGGRLARGPAMRAGVVPRLAIVAVLAAALAGCSGSRRGAADKAGGAQGAPALLRLGFVSWVDNKDD